MILECPWNPISPERWAQIDSIFAEALDVPPETAL
jgi:hypothetical protein